MSVLGKLFGSSKVISTVADTVEKVIYTKKEKENHWLDILKSYEPYKLAQRLVALTVIGVYLLVWMVCAAMMVVSYWLEPMMGLSRELAQENNETLGNAFLIIIIFYFGGGCAEGIVAKFKKQK